MAMKPIFQKAPPLGLRLAITVILSLALIFWDGRSYLAGGIRSAVDGVVSNLFYFANLPRNFLDGVDNVFSDKNKLIAENEALKIQLREKNASLLLFNQLKLENERLRLLLRSPLREDEYKKSAEVLAIESDAYRQQIIVNKGTEQGVYEGQPVIDEKGVVGEVVATNANTSRVLLITDVMNAVPVQVLRNDVRAIAKGTGLSDVLLLDNLPLTVDLQKGDVLVTSGLGGNFLEGYPVATITKVIKDQNNHFAQAYAKPLALLDRLRYLLLLWPTTNNSNKTIMPTQDDVRKIINERQTRLNLLHQLPIDKIKVDSDEESTKNTSEKGN